MIPQTFILIGKSGAGKGTQADLLFQYLTKNDPKGSIFRLETGKKFREFIEKDTYTSQLSKEIYAAGGLMPEFLSISIWANSFIEGLKKGQHMIVDGSPRKIHEAKVLDSAMPFYGRVKPHILYINVSKEWATTRLTERHRIDDNPRDIEARLHWFETDVMPTIEFYRNNPDYDFVEVNGEQSVEEVQAEIISKVFVQEKVHVTH